MYIAADGWLNSDVRYSYLIATGEEKPMYRANSFMLMNPRDTGDNEKYTVHQGTIVHESEPVTTCSLFSRTLMNNGHIVHLKYVNG